MKNSKPHSRRPTKAPAAGGDLELPVEPGFVSVPPMVDPQAMLRRIAGNLRWRSTRPGEAERRLATKVDVEFTL